MRCTLPGIALDEDTQTAIRRFRINTMNWTFYLILALVLLAVLIPILAIRYYVNERLDRIERIAIQKEEEQKISESNSGL